MVAENNQTPKIATSWSTKHNMISTRKEQDPSDREVIFINPLEKHHNKFKQKPVLIKEFSDDVHGKPAK